VAVTNIPLRSPLAGSTAKTTASVPVLAGSKWSIGTVRVTQVKALSSGHGSPPNRTRISSVLGRSGLLTGRVALGTGVTVAVGVALGVGVTVAVGVELAVGVTVDIPRRAVD
jgi:hypothetical protein